MTVKLTQEQIKVFNKIVTAAINLYEIESKLKKDKENSALLQEAKKVRTKLDKLVNIGAKQYGKWFSDRCLEVAKSLLNN